MALRTRAEYICRGWSLTTLGSGPITDVMRHWSVGLSSWITRDPYRTSQSTYIFFRFPETADDGNLGGHLVYAGDHGLSVTSAVHVVSTRFPARGVLLGASCVIQSSSS